MRYYVRPSTTGSHLCEGCGVRLTVGEPSSTTSWYGRLVMTEQQIRYCTEAAVEFDRLTEDAGEGRMTALEFIDWLSPSARAIQSPGSLRHPLTASDLNRHPFPVAMQGNGEHHTKGRP